MVAPAFSAAQVQQFAAGRSTQLRRLFDLYAVTAKRLPPSAVVSKALPVQVMRLKGWRQFVTDVRLPTVMSMRQLTDAYLDAMDASLAPLHFLNFRQVPALHPPRWCWCDVERRGKAGCISGT